MSGWAKASETRMLSAAFKMTSEILAVNILNNSINIRARFDPDWLRQYEAARAERLAAIILEET